MWSDIVFATLSEDLAPHKCRLVTKSHYSSIHDGLDPDPRNFAHHGPSDFLLSGLPGSRAPNSLSSFALSLKSSGIRVIMTIYIIPQDEALMIHSERNTGLRACSDPGAKVSLDSLQIPPSDAFLQSK